MTAAHFTGTYMYVLKDYVYSFAHKELEECPRWVAYTASQGGVCNAQYKLDDGSNWWQGSLCAGSGSHDTVRVEKIIASLLSCFELQWQMVLLPTQLLIVLRPGEPHS